MLYKEFLVGNKEYKLRLRTRDVITVEKLIGCNPLSIFGTKGDEIPTVTTMVTIFHSALQAYEHGITLDRAYDIFDEWITEGHTITEFVPIILELYKVSGLIKNDNTEKN